MLKAIQAIIPLLLTLKDIEKMEEGTGSTITDLSGHGNNGTINGAAWATGKKSSSYNNTLFR